MAEVSGGFSAERMTLAGFLLAAIIGIVQLFKPRIVAMLDRQEEALRLSEARRIEAEERNGQELARLRAVELAAVQDLAALRASNEAKDREHALLSERLEAVLNERREVVEELRAARLEKAAAMKATDELRAEMKSLLAAKHEELRRAHALTTELRTKLERRGG